MGAHHDYLAELYVAGKLADAGWNIYFPHRDQGFDFIITKLVGNAVVRRPVQVKGKYPTNLKRNKPTYGYVGRLSQTHPRMILGIAFFRAVSSKGIPCHIAFMPYSKIRKHKCGWRCQPARFLNFQPLPRRDYEKFFDANGIALLKSDEYDVAKEKA
jgi:hypothetical protein